MKTPDTTVALFSEVGLLIKTRMQRSFPLPFSQCQTIGFIAQREHPSMQDVARYFKIRAPSATFLVEELVRGGYIDRHPNSKDRRRVELELTTKGKRLFKTIEQKKSKVLNELFGPLADTDRTHLNRILKNIISNA